MDAWTKTPRPRRQRGTWTFAPVALAALVALVALGCAAPTPVGPPTFAATIDAPKAYTVDEEITPLVLPAATGGTGALIYSLTPEIPGLQFDAVARELRGTPTETGAYDMTYTARDEKDQAATLEFTITVAEFSLIASVVASIEAGDAVAVPRFEDVPEPSGGPVVTVAGNRAYVAGGSVFLDVEPGPGTDKLLLSIRGRTFVDFGYYEIDLPNGASPQRLVARVEFDLDDLGPLPAVCLAVSAVDAGGAVGPPACHVVINAPVSFGDVQVTVSWDTDADLDLHVADPNGDELFRRVRHTASGGVLDRIAGENCSADGLRNEHAVWSGGAPPPGLYEVRVTHDDSCDAEETNYVVSVYNHGQVTTYSGTFTGPGEYSNRGTGTVIARFEVAGDPVPKPAGTLTATYRGSGDQVFVLNPNGEALDDTVYTLDLGSSSPEVYVIATAGAYHVDPQVEFLRDAADTRSGTVQEQPGPRPGVDEVSPLMQRITAFNNFNDGPPVWKGSAGPGRIQALQERLAPAEGQRFIFVDPDEEAPIPVTLRRVATDGAVTAAVWVADQEWAPTCASRGECVTQEMVDGVAERFLRPGGNNDIYDWVTAIFGAPWGPHDVLGADGEPFLIPAEAAEEIHILMYDIGGDGVAPSIAGYFWGIHNQLRQPDDDLLQYSLERLILFMDSPLLTVSEDGFFATLAHEFQHVIHFYQKPVLRDAYSETWLNEQASEVAEDLIADKLMVRGPRGVDGDDPTAGEPENRRGRLNLYNLYNDFQVTGWDGSSINYSLVYAFGAYLARNYGGAALFRDIVQSDRWGVDAVEAALRAHGHDESFLDLLTNWGAANLLSDNTDAPAPYRYNTGDWRISHAGGMEYRLGSINLYNYIIGRPGRLARPGPYLHPLPVFNDRTQPPHSNMYTTLGRQSGTLRLSVTAESENRITVVVKE